MFGITARIFRSAEVQLAACALIVLSAAGWTSTAKATGGKLPEIERARAEPAQVRVQGDTVYYTGNFSKVSSAAFDAAVAGIARGQITRLVISSGGGDTVAGRHVGRWVRDMGLVVEVDVICFSSCADYIFPAGRARVIRTDAFVGWHGNERTFHVQAARKGISLAEQLAQYVPRDTSPEQRTAFFRDFEETTKVTMKEEADFYSQLGLNDVFAVCAVGDVLEKRSGYSGQIGWGFTIPDMARFGMTNTVYLGDGAYEDSARFQKYLMRISADECQSMLK
ncbi:hypothetical protein GL272_13990 [Aeromonas veronii]|uniref:hypothetical protein n=1 Tax=Aeromonas veronii TaxID=654 RepID=UPI001302BCE4|nr:hypothetical protein [Aeromonas veronii]KAE9625327.1 hypothetical protein GO627_08025 [Aeromonas veronii]MBW3778022.1 hypothetical protein [Aeromonas veronii]